MELKLALLGFGNVGRALAGLLLERKDLLRHGFGLSYRVVGIATRSHGVAVNPDGIDLEMALDLARRGDSLDRLHVGESLPPGDGVTFIRACPADLVFEATWLDPKAGQPATDHVRTALEMGRHVVTANKGPVAFAYRELSALAREHGVGFFFESTVLDGAPALGLGREALPGAEIESIRGVLNSTTNYILSRIEEGASFEQALSEMQAAGLAEADPSFDVDGWDSAVKITVLANVLMGADLRPQDVDRAGIRGLPEREIRETARSGRHYRLVCRAWCEGASVVTKVAPEVLPPHDPMAQVRGTSSVVAYRTDVLPELILIERDPSPVTTAFGMLADMVNVARGRYRTRAI